MCGWCGAFLGSLVPFTSFGVAVCYGHMLCSHNAFGTVPSE